ncbi:hypothetical protein [Gracilinema caldarium]|uniref:Uncharacterized protein n=1 Tax=Gracilinema caldarium (strain ATCC 51460 / DSM 7334 / H1) TaxID=744872 RepID=F8EYC9_GRAC1|nr:hypothetical protein [Gracilinema caldarium]AEJ18288.1 hypothetical protein Spica_0120 [Gracilinema caldarium DSM 7334]
MKNPQLKHDPAFLRKVEQILEQEIDTVQTWNENTVVVPAASEAEQKKIEDSEELYSNQNRSRSKVKKSRKNVVLKELEALLPELDEEGLAFLLEQGRIHLYNMKVDGLNALSQSMDQPITRKSRNKAADQSADTSKKTGPRTKDTSEPSFQIKAGSGGGSYHVAYRGNWKLFSDTEMLKMVQIAHGEGTQTERANRLFRWLRTERSDVFQDIPFQSAQQPLFMEFLCLLQRTFTIRTAKK